jgi:FkbM family methyltransferase
MLKTRLIGIRWLFSNIGFLKTIRILLDIFFKKPKEYLVNFKCNTKEARMFIKSERTDLAMLTEIFCFEAYEIKREITSRLIVDGGANKGSAAIYFGLRYPDAKIHCYEPNAELIPILKKNIELNNINAYVFNEALGDKTGDSFFEINENHQYSKLSNKDTKFKVRVISLNEKYAGQKIDILKLDIEGEEERVISSIDFDSLAIVVIIQEIHYSMVNFEEIKKTLEGNGYNLEKPYSQYKFLNPDVAYPILIADKEIILS